MTPVPLIILGTGGNCIDILEAVTTHPELNSRFSVTGFLDDDPKKQGMESCGLPVLGQLRDAEKFESASFVNGIGSPDSFLQKPACIAATGIDENRFATVVHPDATISPSACLGAGTVVLANTTICAGVTIGRHVMVLPGCVLSHDCRIDDYTIVASGSTLCGKVHVAQTCYVGAGSVILNDLAVAAHSLVGAGSVVTRNVPVNTVVVGNPARRHRCCGYG